MTQHMRSAEQIDIDSPLPELPRLRELSQLDAPSKNVSRAVFVRLQHTMSGESQAPRNELRVRTWALALGLTVAVPTAFAATPAGGALVERTVEWATSILQLQDSTSAAREMAKTNGARGVNPSAHTEAKVSPPTPGANVVNNGGPTVAPAAPPVAVFESAKDPITSGASVAPNNTRAPATPQALTRPMPAAARPSAATPVASIPGPAIAPAAASPKVTTLNAERLMLEDARARLRAGDARGALALTSRHAEQFPDGILSAERQAIIKQVRQLEGQSP